MEEGRGELEGGRGRDKRREKVRDGKRREIGRKRIEEKGKGGR